MSDEKTLAETPVAAQPAAPATEAKPQAQPSTDAQAPSDAKASAPAERKVHPNKVAYEALAELYPDLFNVKAPKPLKIGIHVDLAEDGKLSKTKIRRALNFYVKQLSYIRSVAEGGKRYSLNGEAGEVSAEDAAHALVRVKEIEAKRKAKRAERRAQEVKNGTAKEQPSRPRRPRNTDPKAAGKPRTGTGKPAAGKPKRSTQAAAEPAEDQGLSKEERLNKKLASLANRFNNA